MSDMCRGSQRQSPASRDKISASRADIRPPLSDLTPEGSYTWLPPAGLAHWCSIASLSMSAPSRFPRLLWSVGPILPGARRRTLASTSRGRVLGTAALIDGGGVSRRRVAQGLRGEPSKPHNKDDWAAQQVKRDLRAGRSVLHALRVIPWVCWHDGSVPSEWWRSAEFEEAIGLWREASAIAAAEMWGRLRAEHRLAEALPNAWTNVSRPSLVEVGLEYHELAEARLEALREQPWTFPAYYLDRCASSIQSSALAEP